MPRLSLQEIEDLAFRALTASRTREDTARCVAISIAAAEADGIASHGLLRLPLYCAHIQSGKVDGFATPKLERASPSVVQVDACNGFAHPAIELALNSLAPLAAEQGIAAASVRNSYNSGVMGHHVEHLARRGLVAIGFSNAPAVIAPWGGKKPVFGTNPIAFAAGSPGEDPIVIDQASSVVARGEVILRKQRGESIPEGWALDRDGHPTTDPEAALEGGSMVPAGGYKGATLALMVEVLAAAITGALASAQAGTLTQVDAKHAGLGQLFIAMDPNRFGADGFADRLQALQASITCQPGARLPGARRFAERARARREGVLVNDELHAKLARLAQPSAP